MGDQSEPNRMDEAVSTKHPSAPVAMVREDRYIVIKRSDLRKLPVAYHSHMVKPMLSLLSHLPRREYLVIESDWPEYEPAWRMVEARVNCAEQPPAVGGEPEVFGFGIDVSGYTRMFSKTREKADEVSRHYVAIGHKAPVVELIDRAHVAPLLADIDRLNAGLKWESERNELLLKRVTELEAAQGEAVQLN